MREPDATQPSVQLHRGRACISFVAATYDALSLPANGYVEEAASRHDPARTVERRRAALKAEVEPEEAANVGHARRRAPTGWRDARGAVEFCTSENHRH